MTVTGRGSQRWTSYSYRGQQAAGASRPASGDQVTGPDHRRGSVDGRVRLHETGSLSRDARFHQE